MICDYKNITHIESSTSVTQNSKDASLDFNLLIILCVSCGLFGIVVLPRMFWVRTQIVSLLYLALMILIVAFAPGSGEADINKIFQSIRTKDKN